MSLRARLVALAACAAAAPAAPAAADARGADVAVALTEDEIRVTSRFAGARVVVFGVVQGLTEDDALVVALKGPERPLIVRRKRRVAGIWVNGAPTRVEGAPSFYAAAASRDITDAVTQHALREAQLGPDYVPLTLAPGSAAPAAGTPDDIRRAIATSKRRSGLYEGAVGEVTILQAGLFRADLTLPAGAPTGDYRARAVLVRDGAIAARAEMSLPVNRVGLERLIYDLAHERPFLYGLMAVALAVFAGWTGAALFRRR